MDTHKSYCEQYYDTGQCQTCMCDGKTRRAFAMTQTEEDQVKADHYG